MWQIKIDFITYLLGIHPNYVCKKRKYYRIILYQKYLTDQLESLIGLSVQWADTKFIEGTYARLLCTIYTCFTTLGLSCTKRISLLQAKLVLSNARLNTRSSNGLKRLTINNT